MGKEKEYIKQFLDDSIGYSDLIMEIYQIIKDYKDETQETPDDRRYKEELDEEEHAFNREAGYE